MSALLIAVVIVAYLGALGTAMLKVLNATSEYPTSDRPKAIRWGSIGGILIVVGLAVLIYGVQHADDKGPCLRYETGYQLVGKVMVPYQYCVERGEWSNK